MSPTHMSLLEAGLPEGLHDPLAWFAAEHARHRDACRRMLAAAEAASFDAAAIKDIIAFLREDMPAHILDEEQVLFPMLRGQALDDDEIEDVLARLSAEHRADGDRQKQLLALLGTCLERTTAPRAITAAADALQSFAEDELRHLALENAMVLPIAKLRFATEDLQALTSRLAARRGATTTTGAPAPKPTSQP